MQVRIATLDDRSVLDDVIERSYGELFQGWYDEETLAKALPLMSAANPRLLESGTYYVVEEEGHVIAAGGWTASAPAGSGLVAGVGHIRHFATDPNHLRKGAARLLMARVVAEARLKGIGRLECISSLPAESFYRSVGFSVVRRDTVAFTDEVSIQAVYMVRVLEA